MGRREPALQLAIMASALDSDRDVREAAMRALVGWADEGVHRFMLMQLARTRSSPDWIQTSLVAKVLRISFPTTLSGRLMSRSTAVTTASPLRAPKLAVTW